jgi:hypothetical protein
MRHERRQRIVQRLELAEIHQKAAMLAVTPTGISSSKKQEVQSRPVNVHLLGITKIQSFWHMYYISRVPFLHTVHDSDPRRSGF